MDWLKLFVQRRLIGAALVAVAGWLGLEGAEGQMEKLIAALTGFVPAATMLWSYAQKNDGPELYRRLIAGLIPVVYTLVGQLLPDMPDAARSSFAQSLAGVVGGLLSVWSFAQANRIRPSSLASPNP